MPPSGERGTRATITWRAGQTQGRGVSKFDETIMHVRAHCRGMLRPPTAQAHEEARRRKCCKARSPSLHTGVTPSDIPQQTVHVYAGISFTLSAPLRPCRRKMGACLGCAPAHAPAHAPPPLSLSSSARPPAANVSCRNGDGTVWTEEAWRSACETFAWRLDCKRHALGFPASFEDLLRHVDAQIEAGAVPHVSASCVRVLHWQWKLQRTGRIREFARQVRVLERDRARLCNTMDTLLELHASRGTDVASASAGRTVPAAWRLHSFTKHFRTVCAAVEGAVAVTELHMQRLGFAFAVDAFAARCCA